MIDHLNPANWNKPLWCVYGITSFPQLLCCKISNESRTPSIWGYSVWKRQAGFRTLGIAIGEWVARHELCKFYDDQDLALAELKRITTPKVSK